MSKGNKITIGLLILILGEIFIVNHWGETKMYDAREWINKNAVNAGDKAIQAAIDSAVVRFGLTPNQKVELYRMYYINESSLQTPPYEDYN